MSSFYRAGAVYAAAPCRRYARTGVLTIGGSTLHYYAELDERHKAAIRYRDKKNYDKASETTKQEVGVTTPLGTLEKLHGVEFGGVVPPALRQIYMTTTLHSHQQTALKELRYWRRHQLYPSDTIHNVELAIKDLRDNIIGFFLLAPLDWGSQQYLGSNPTKATGIGVDTAAIPSSERTVCG